MYQKVSYYENLGYNRSRSNTNIGSKRHKQSIMVRQVIKPYRKRERKYKIPQVKVTLKDYFDTKVDESNQGAYNDCGIGGHEVQEVQHHLNMSQIQPQGATLHPSIDHGNNLVEIDCDDNGQVRKET